LRWPSAADYHAPVIDYATLCTAIDNWKAGQQPSAVPPPAPRRVSAPPVEEDEAVEYSAVYETGDVAEARPEEPVESTVIYQLPEYEDGEEPVEAEDDGEVAELDSDEQERA
jgi:hypothetical protein